MKGFPTWYQGAIWTNVWRKGKELKYDILEPKTLQVGQAAAPF